MVPLVKHCPWPVYTETMHLEPLIDKLLQDNILSAYGTCDFIHSLDEEDLRRKMEEELLGLVFACSNSLHTVRDFEKTYLLEKAHDLPALVSSLSLPVFKARGSRLMEDFLWADEYFQTADPSFGFQNTNLLQTIFNQIIDRYSPSPEDWHERWKKEIVEAARSEQIEPERTGLDPQPEKLKESLEQLDHLIGLENVKTEIRDLCALLEISRLRQARGFKTAPIARHLVFSGNPGTGKTTTARILARIYKNLGFLSKGQLIECDRSDLVGEYIGSSAQKTKAMIKKAKGGVLFIDEAYALARKSEKDFGQEVIEVLIKEMEDNRNDLVVIAAGYPDRMEQFLSSNPGLRSRFTTFIHFDNYTADQLLEILIQMAADADYIIDKNALDRIHEQFVSLLENPPKDFANARTVRNLLEKAITAQARRLFGSSAISDEDLQVLKPEDFAFLYPSNH